MRSLTVPRGRLAISCCVMALMVGLAGAASASPPSGTPSRGSASADDCSSGTLIDGFYYMYGGYYDPNYANQGVDANLQEIGPSVHDINTDHVLVIVDAQTAPGTDPPTSKHYDWIQDGEGYGEVGGHVADTTEVYNEHLDYIAYYEMYYPTYPANDEWFGVDNTGQSGGNGTELYDAYEIDSNNNVYDLHASYQVDPTQHRIIQNVEGSYASRVPDMRVHRLTKATSDIPTETLQGCTSTAIAADGDCGSHSTTPLTRRLITASFWWTLITYGTRTDDLPTDKH